MSKISTLAIRFTDSTKKMEGQKIFGTKLIQINAENTHTKQSKSKIKTYLNFQDFVWIWKNNFYFWSNELFFYVSTFCFHNSLKIHMRIGLYDFEWLNAHKIPKQSKEAFRCVQIQSETNRKKEKNYIKHTQMAMMMMN